MILHWMAWCALVAALLALGAAALERAVEGFGRPVRWIWLGSLALSLVAPVALWFAPAGTETVRAPEPAADGAGGSGAQVLLEIPAGLVRGAGPALPSLDRPLLAAWAVTSAGLLAGLLALGWTLRRRRREWSPAVVDGRAVLVSPDTGPAVVGLLRSAIVLPRWALEAPEGVRELMIAHEEEHLRARDPRLLLAGIVVAVAMPWSPAVWWQLRRLRLAVEVDCDRRVLRGKQDVKAYGTLLLEIGRRARTGVLAVAAFSEPVSFLERRIRTMTRPRVRAPLLRAAAFCGVASLAVAAACEAPRPGRLTPVASAVVTDDPARARSAPPAREQVRQLVAEHFPDVLTRGMQGNDMLTFVVDSEGRVLTSSIAKREPAPGVPGQIRMEGVRPGTDPATVTVEAIREPRRVEQARERIPASGLERIDPNDIDAVQVSKEEAGRLGPDPVNVIVVELKPGVTLEESARRAAEHARSLPRKEAAPAGIRIAVENGESRQEGTTPRGVVQAAVQRTFPNLATGEKPSQPLIFVVDETYAVVRSGIGMESLGIGRTFPAQVKRVEIFKNERGIQAGPHTVDVLWIILKEGATLPPPGTP